MIRILQVISTDTSIDALQVQVADADEIHCSVNAAHAKHKLVPCLLFLLAL